MQDKLTELEESVAVSLTKLKGKIQATDAELIKNLSFAFPNYNSIVAGKYIESVRSLVDLASFL